MVALRELLGNEFEEEAIRSFEEAMSLREEADYGLIFSEEGATEVINNAERFLKKAKELLRI